MARPRTSNMNLDEYRRYLADLAIRRSEKEYTAALADEKRAIRAEILGAPAPRAPRAPRAPLPTDKAAREAVLMARVRAKADKVANRELNERVKGRCLSEEEIRSVIRARGGAGYEAAMRDRRFPSTVEPSTVEPSTVEPSTVEPSTAVEPSTVEPSIAIVVGAHGANGAANGVSIGGVHVI